MLMHGPSPVDADNPMPRKHSEDTGRPLRCTLRVLETRHLQAAFLAQADKVIVREQDKVPGAMKAAPVVMTKQPLIERTYVGCFDEDPAVVRQQVPNTAQNTPGIRHMLDQVEHQDEVKAAIGRKIFDPTTMVDMSP